MKSKRRPNGPVVDGEVNVNTMTSTQRLASDTVAITRGNISVIVARRLRFPEYFYFSCEIEALIKKDLIFWSLGGTL